MSELLLCVTSKKTTLMSTCGSGRSRLVITWPTYLLVSSSVMTITRCVSGSTEIIASPTVPLGVYCRVVPLLVPEETPVPPPARLGEVVVRCCASTPMDGHRIRPTRQIATVRSIEVHLLMLNLVYLAERLALATIQTSGVAESRVADPGSTTRGRLIIRLRPAG